MDLERFAEVIKKYLTEPEWATVSTSEDFISSCPPEEATALGKVLLLGNPDMKNLVVEVPSGSKFFVGIVRFR